MPAPMVLPIVTERPKVTPRTVSNLRVSTAGAGTKESLKGMRAGVGVNEPAIGCKSKTGFGLGHKSKTGLGLGHGLGQNLHSRIHGVGDRDQCLERNCPVPPPDH